MQWSQSTAKDDEAQQDARGNKGRNENKIEQVHDNMA